MKTFYWLLKREFWENRGSFLWAPVVTGGIFLLLNLMGIITAEVLGARHGIHFSVDNGLQRLVQNMDAGDMRQVGMGLDIAMYSAMGMIAIVLGFVVLFYCLGSLYNDRHDRSVLFWKSLPISNTQTVLSKIASAVVVAPAIAIAAGIAAGLLQLLMIAVVLSFHGVNVWQLLLLAHPFRVAANLAGIVPLYALWAAPAVGWLMLCSAWARGKPFLWAVALPVMTGVVVGWFGLMGLFNQSTAWFWTHVVLRALISVFPYSALLGIDPHNLPAFAPDDGDRLGFLNLGHTYQLLGTANLWIGVAAGAVLIAGAIWLRRVRDDS